MEQNKKSALDKAVERLAAMSIANVESDDTQFFINDAFPTTEEKTKFFMRSVNLYLNTVGSDTELARECKKCGSLLPFITAASLEFLDDDLTLVAYISRTMECVFETAAIVGRIVSTVNGNIKKYSEKNDESEAYYRGLAIRCVEAILSGDMAAIAKEAMDTVETEEESEEESEDADKDKDSKSFASIFAELEKAIDEVTYAIESLNR